MHLRFLQQQNKRENGRKWFLILHTHIGNSLSKIIEVDINVLWMVIRETVFFLGEVVNLRA